jgi:ribosomal protein S18 acetylase RimI-like enzyme
MKIRRARLKDATMLAGVIRAAFRDVAERFGLTPENCPRHPSNCTVGWVERSAEAGARHFLAEEDGQPCGSVAVKPAGRGVYYMERLAVLPAFRRKGIGRALVRRALEEARRLGAHAVRIGIIAEHTEVRAWYERQGFVLTGTRTFRHLPFTVAFMEQRVGPTEPGEPGQ